MQILTFNSTSFYKVLFLSMGMFLSGCSNKSEVNSASYKQKPDKQESIQSAKPTAQDLQHTHPSNPCTAAVVHTHHYETSEHEHSYDCENTNEFVNNAHIHPATEVSMRTRHVHPNGANKHSHHR